MWRPDLVETHLQVDKASLNRQLKIRSRETVQIHHVLSNRTRLPHSPCTRSNSDQYKSTKDKMCRLQRCINNNNNSSNPTHLISRFIFNHQKSSSFRNKVVVKSRPRQRFNFWKRNFSFRKKFWLSFNEQAGLWKNQHHNSMQSSQLSSLSIVVVKL